jgi:exoribonuclease R
MQLKSSLLAIVALIVLMSGGCSNSSKNQSSVERPIPVSSPTPTPSPVASATPVPKLPPPSQDQVEAAFHRVFGDSLIASTSSRAFFIVGDFNGDESEDLALIARSAPGKLQEVNSELSNWTIQDADKALSPVSTKKVVPRNEERPTVANGEEVLAIIHGVGPAGWRTAEARQAYIVKHAAATLLGTAPSVSQKAIRAMHLPQETDIIKQVRNKKKGFLFWTGGVYAWHPSEG